MTSLHDTHYSHQPLTNFIRVLAALGVRNAIVSPGSRCAPLTLSLARHPSIYTRTISDERSAAFIALGIAQQLNEPVVLACTSGTAALNYAPAIAEAYFQQLPLLVLTADRPPEWVGQQDGQTIFQQGVHGLHTKKSYQLPPDYSHPDSQWFMQRVAAEAFYLSKEFPAGPVHVNVPIREPFYPKTDTQLDYDSPLRVIREWQPTQETAEPFFAELGKEFAQYTRVLIVGGQERREEDLRAHLARLPIGILCDVVSNLQGLPNSIHHQDLFLSQLSEEDKDLLKPKLLITFGKSIISKNVKLFLRKFPPEAHWHIQEKGAVADTFQTLTQVIRLSPLAFFKALRASPFTSDFTYLNTWLQHDRAVRSVLFADKTTHAFEELSVMKAILAQIPKGAKLHLANSMVVRYANFIGLRQEMGIEVFANRGTSGIDGTVSTAVGHALAAPEHLHVLITGDLSFLYDRNALWHVYDVPNLKVIVLNNHGGIIFKMIDGPARLPEADEFFQTKQPLKATPTALEAGWRCYFADNWQSFQDTLQPFWDTNSTKGSLWEIELDGNLVVNELHALKKSIRKKLSEST